MGALLSVILIAACLSLQQIDPIPVIRPQDVTPDPVPAWQQYEDSLRNVILGRKENVILKNSFLQELYVRDAVHVSGDSLVFKIPFDLHGPDCGAPDCYCTDIRFSFPLGDKLAFPEEVWIEEREHGCVDAETYQAGRFRLTEQTDRCVIYHSSRSKRTLVLLRTGKEGRVTAYYFTGVNRGAVNGQNVTRLLETYDEHDVKAIYPFRSGMLTTQEYESFLEP